MSELKYLKNDDKEQVVIDATVYTGEKAKEIKKKIEVKTPVTEDTKQEKEVYLKG
jgi:hypothetical protein